MVVAEARALVARQQPHIVPLDDAWVERALERLGVRLLIATPTVALDGTGGLWLDATGCERVYRGIDRMMGRIVAWCTKVGLATRLAAAPTWGAAWALARFGGEARTRVDERDVQANVARLPLAALRIDAAMIERLAVVGIVRVEHLLAIPRAALAQRYGGVLLRRLDQALGRVDESITPIRPREPVTAEVFFDGSTTRLEDVQRCIAVLIERVAEQLASRGEGCRRVDATLTRSDLPPISMLVRVSRPTHDARHIWKLMHPQTERLQLGFGVTGVRVRVENISPMTHRQAQAWEDEGSGRGPSPRAVGTLLDVLMSRLPRERVCRLVTHESHVPERAYFFEPVESIEGVGDGRAASLSLVRLDRPSLLHDRPLPIDVVLLVPDGPIAAIRGGPGAGRIRASIGPERIEPEWWRGDGSPRDYFKVQVDDGRWLWIYRDLATQRWHWHGTWA